MQVQGVVFHKSETRALAVRFLLLTSRQHSYTFLQLASLPQVLWFCLKLSSDRHALSFNLKPCSFTTATVAVRKAALQEGFDAAIMTCDPNHSYAAFSLIYARI